MTATTVCLVVLGAVAIGPLAVVLVRFNVKRRHIIRCAERAEPEQLERIYALVERAGNGPACAAVLARTNATAADPTGLIPLPADLAGFPWAGRTVLVDARDPAFFRLIDR